MTGPKCPSCEINGIEYIHSTPSNERAKDGRPWFYVVHCTECGHVYDTMAKTVFINAQGTPMLYLNR